jgi:hypothetical protein
MRYYSWLPGIENLSVPKIHNLIQYARNELANLVPTLHYGNKACCAAALWHLGSTLYFSVCVYKYLVKLCQNKVCSLTGAYLNSIPCFSASKYKLAPLAHKNQAFYFVLHILTIILYRIKLQVLQIWDSVCCAKYVGVNLIQYNNQNWLQYLVNILKYSKYLGTNTVLEVWML